MSSTSPPFTRRRAVLALVQCAAAAAALPGCAGYYYGDRDGPTLGVLMRESLAESSQSAARQLLRGVALAPGTPVAVQALTNIDPAAAAAPFGRVVARQLVGALVRAGIAVAPEADSPAAQALDAAMQARQPPLVLAGSYAVSARQVYVSLRLARTGQAVLAAVDYAVALDDDVRALLRA